MGFAKSHKGRRLDVLGPAVLKAPYAPTVLKWITAVGTFVCGTTRALPHLVRRDLIPAAGVWLSTFCRGVPALSSGTDATPGRTARDRTRVPRTVAAPRRGWERSRKSHRPGPVTDEATGIDRPQATQVHFSCEHVLEFVEEQHMGADWGVIQLARRHPVVTLFVLAYGLSWAVQIPRAFGVLEGSGWRAVVWAPAVAAVVAGSLVGACW